MPPPPSMPKSTITYQCLATIQLIDGRVRRFQNWQRQPLYFNARKYVYFNFPLPPLTRSIGERAESVSLILPNVGASEYGYMPLREWAQGSELDNALITFDILDGGNTLYQHSFIVAERVFQSIDNRSTIELRLRQPDDRNATVMTAIYSYSNVGEPPSFSAF